MKITAIYPGTFDPFTNGHLDIVRRASALFPRVIVAVTNNSHKKTMFPAEDRIMMARRSLSSFSNVTVDSFSGLLVDYVARKKAHMVIRGLRAISDFEYEFQMALMNRRLRKSFETVFLTPDEQYTFLSSSLVKEIARLGGDITDFVPIPVQKKIKTFFKHVSLHNDTPRNK